MTKNEEAVNDSNEIDDELLQTVTGGAEGFRYTPNQNYYTPKYWRYNESGWRDYSSYSPSTPDSSSSLQNK